MNKTAATKSTTTDDVASLLASSGTDIIQQSQYEEQVIIDATLSTAPKLPLFALTDNHHADVTASSSAGLPDLTGLVAGGECPSNEQQSRKNGSRAGDIRCIMKVLSKTRSELCRLRGQNSNIGSDADETKEELKLRIKVQMLLSYLENELHVHPDDMPSFDEALEERDRSLTILSVDTCSSSQTLHVAGNDDEHKKRALELSGREDGNVKNGIKRKVLSESQKLERIKKGFLPTTSISSFGKQALVDRQRNLDIQKTKRSTMMSIKRQMLSEVEGEYDRDDADIIRMLERRKKKREDRRKLREERRRQRAVTVVACDDEDNADENNFSKEDSDAQCRGLDDQIKIDNEATSCDDEGEVSSRVMEITCPICDSKFTVSGAEGEADAFLSLHIDSCQRRGGRVTRASGRGFDYSEENVQGGGQSEKATQLTKSPWSKPKISSLEKRKKLKIAPVAYGESASQNISSLDDFKDWCYDDRVEEWIESGIERMREMDERDKDEDPPGAVLLEGGFLIPAWINNRLFSYQRTALSWLWELHKQGAGGIIGDEMGLGKTVQLCSFLGAMASCRQLDSVLIICPATVLNHWLNELKIWAPGMRRILIHNSGEKDSIPRSISLHLLTALDKWLRRARKYRTNEPIDATDDEGEDRFCGTGYCILTTYEQVRRYADVYTHHLWSYVVMDEGQKIRNPDAGITLSCKRFRCPHRILLSGTPIQNNLRELWSLFDFVFPGRLGTLPAFMDEFAEPIRRGGYSNASRMQVQLAYRCALVLRDLINPYLLRRQKKDIREVERMPGKTEQVLFCRLSNRQRALYEAYLSSNEVLRVLSGNAQCFRSITILRKLCNHPDLVCDASKSSFEVFLKNNGPVDDCSSGGSSDDGEIESDDENMTPGDGIAKRSGKLGVLAKILPLWYKQGHRVLIFSQTRKMLDILQRFTRSQGWNFSRLDGNTNVGSRQKLIDKFNSDKNIFGMLLTTRTGGVGVNLTGADRIILYDPDWNPQTDAQARERAWRFGQKRSVTVYRLITAGTIEEKIYQRQIFKTALSNQILQDPRQRRLFSQKDLKDFFTLKSDVHSVSNGGDGCTDTAAAIDSGVIQAKDVPQGQKDNSDTLKSVLRNKGLAGIFDHDFVVDPSINFDKVEEEATKVAKEAAVALADSISPRHSSRNFTPTWTGPAERSNGRFGGTGNLRQLQSTNNGSLSNSFCADAGFGGASTAGVNVPIAGSMSSSSAIAKLKRKREGGNVSSGNTSKYTQLMKRIRDFLIQHSAAGGPTTGELLDAFSNVPDRDAAIFKRLLNTIARKRRGRWTLTDDV